MQLIQFLFVNNIIGKILSLDFFKNSYFTYVFTRDFIITYNIYICVYIDR